MTYWFLPIDQDRDDADAEVLWQEGDSWVDLAPLIESGSGASVITHQGTVKLFRFAEPPARGAWYARIPLQGGFRMWWDGTWGRLDDLRATPCGMYVEEPDHTWEESTPVRLVLRGLYPRWWEVPLAADTARRVRNLEPVPVPTGHPPAPCCARYCCAAPSRSGHWAGGGSQVSQG